LTGPSFFFPRGRGTLCPFFQKRRLLHLSFFLVRFRVPPLFYSPGLWPLLNSWFFLFHDGEATTSHSLGAQDQKSLGSLFFFFAHVLSPSLPFGFQMHPPGQTLSSVTPSLKGEGPLFFFLSLGRQVFFFGRMDRRSVFFPSSPPRSPIHPAACQSSLKLAAAFSFAVGPPSPFFYIPPFSTAGYGPFFCSAGRHPSFFRQLKNFFTLFPLRLKTGNLLARGPLFLPANTLFLITTFLFRAWPTRLSKFPPFLARAPQGLPS